MAAGFPVKLTNGGKGDVAEVYKGDDNSVGLLTYTLPRFEEEGGLGLFSNPTLGIEMNVDGSSTPSLTENIHDGTDTVYWTASALNGTWDFASTAQAHAGTKSIDATATLDNNQARLDKGSTLDLTPYETLTGWIYISSWPSSGTKEVLLQFEDASQVLLGNTVDIGQYVNQSTTGAWQKFIIPLADIGVVGNTIQSILITTVDIGGGQPPDYYLDDIALTDATAGISFTLEPDLGDILHVTRVRVLIEDVYAATSSTGGHPFSMSGFLGVGPLTNGILFSQFSDGKVIFSFTSNDLRDALRSPNAQEITSGSDGTNTWVAYDFVIEAGEGIALDSSTRDKLVVTIRDDLTGLVSFTNIGLGYIRKDS